MGATQVVAWIDWLRGTGERPADPSLSTFFTIEHLGRRFLTAAEFFLPYLRSRFWLDGPDFPRFWLHWDEIERWRRFSRSGPANIFAMDEKAAKIFLYQLSF